MNNKDIVNKISGIIAIIAAGMIIVGIIIENDSILGFPNAMMLYPLLSTVLIWFGTRKNGCGSCNQSCSTSEPEETEPEKA